MEGERRLTVKRACSCEHTEETPERSAAETGSGDTLEGTVFVDLDNGDARTDVHE